MVQRPNLVHQATALPQGLEAQDGNAVTSKEARELGMKWTGSIFPGAEPTVLYGDVNVRQNSNPLGLVYLIY